jgi:uncharacterized protein YegP (UPF0339 family)
MSLPKYEVYCSASGGWRWRLKSANGEIVASGEAYTRRQDALRGVEAHRRAAIRAQVAVI